MTDTLLAVLMNGLVLLSQSTGGVEALTRVDSIEALRVVVARGDVDLMAAYQLGSRAESLSANVAVGCFDSGETKPGKDDEKKAMLAAVSNLSKRRDLNLSGRENLNHGVWFSESVERSVSRINKTRLIERMTFDAPKGAITCILIREG